MLDCSEIIGRVTKEKKFRKAVKHFYLIKKVIQKFNDTEENFMFATAKVRIFLFTLATKG